MDFSLIVVQFVQYLIFVVDIMWDDRVNWEAWRDIA